MKEFIISLYSNENFPIYLGAIIIVLLIAFFVVFFLGKKDKKKIEMTQKLEKINAEAFKEVSAPVDVNVAVPVVEENQNVNLEVEPKVEENLTIQEAINQDSNVQIPKQEEFVINNDVVNEIPEVPTIELPEIPSQSIEINEQPIINFTEEKPALEPIVETPDLSNFNALANSIENELSELEKRQALAKPLIETQPVNIENNQIENSPIIEQPVLPSVDKVDTSIV